MLSPILTPAALESPAALRRFIWTSAFCVHWFSGITFAGIARYACFYAYPTSEGSKPHIYTFTLAIGGFTIFTFSPIDVFYPGLAIVTVLVNLIFATLIVVRILNYQRQISKLLGKAYGSPYTRIISICVESCALITITYLVFLFFVFLHPFSSWWTARMLTVYASVSLPSQIFIMASSFKSTLIL